MLLMCLANLSVVLCAVLNFLCSTNGALCVLLSEIPLLGKEVWEERSSQFSNDKLNLMQLSLTQESVLYVEKEHSFLT